ncbi:MAG: hypothetical protein HZA46_03245 [Planctomycetales bacterium]|nr:hypothetical protein [Planctomycetales bacterium]
MFGLNFGLERRSADCLPDFDELGWLPATHGCQIEEFSRRFGQSSARRKSLMMHVQEMVHQGRSVGARRLIIGGSFVTSAENPRDVDAAMLVSDDVFARLEGRDSALLALYELSTLNSSYDPAIQLFLAHEEKDWWGWYRLFSQPRDFFRQPEGADRLFRGVVEIRL